MTRRKRNEPKLSEQEILENLPAAFRLLGRSMPVTPDEVARVEAALSQEDSMLPRRLVDPFAILDSQQERQPVQRTTASPPAHVLAELRQAARFGGEVPDDVRTQMAEDRAREERASDDQGEDD